MKKNNGWLALASTKFARSPKKKGYPLTGSPRTYGSAAFNYIP